MRCMNCGYNCENDFAFCPHCGAPAGAGMAPPAAEPLHPEGMRILSALKDPSFLTICILLSVSCGATVLSGGGVPLIILLIMIFLWQVYGKSKKGLVDTKQLRNVSGAVYANYVLTYVGAVLTLVAGVIFGLVLGLITANTNLINEALADIGEYAEAYRWILELLFSLSGGLMMVIFAVISVLMVVINLLMLRPIHRFAKAVYQAPNGVMIEPNVIASAKTWLMVSGCLSILAGVSSLLGGSLMGALGSGCTGAAAILASSLVTKYFM